MLFKKKINKTNFENFDAAIICATCKYASPLHATDDYICHKKGLVSFNYACRHYDYNRLLKRPPKKRQLNMSRVDSNDFNI